MKIASKSQNYEDAARMRNQLLALQNLSKQIVFSDKEFMDISKDHALAELVSLLGLPAFPKRIEGYDISHQQGTDVVASMVVFTNGVSNKSEYRKFKTKINKNDDFYNMHETIKRRFSEKNVTAWGKPALVLIDGGKGQLDAAVRARDEMGFQTIPFIGLAKREEQIVVANGRADVNINATELQKLGGFMKESADFTLINVPHSSHLVKLLQRIRDESHRFAVSYHSVLKVKRQTASTLEDIPTIGPATRKMLIRTFGSVRGVMQARDWELEKVVGEKKAALLKQYLRPLKRDAREDK